MELIETKLSTEERQAIVAAAKELRAGDASLTMGKFGKIMGLTGPAVSCIFSGKYKVQAATSDKHLHKLQIWMKERLTRQEMPDSEFALTTIAGRILACCDLAWETPSIAKIITPAGAGKTMALEYFASQGNGRVLYIQAGEAHRTYHGLVWELASVLKIKCGDRMRTAQLQRNVHDKLRDLYLGGQAAPACILVDEATALDGRAINYLRNLHDDRETRCAIVLADTWRMDTDLPRIAGGYEQLRRRFGAVYCLDPREKMCMADVKAVAVKVLESFGWEGKLANESLLLLQRIANDPTGGKLGNVKTRIWAAKRIAENAGEEPTFSPSELNFVADMVGQQGDASIPLPTWAQPQAQRAVSA